LKPQHWDFALVAGHRTGSIMVGTLLDSHPKIDFRWEANAGDPPTKRKDAKAVVGFMRPDMLILEPERLKLLGRPKLIHLVRDETEQAQDTLRLFAYRDRPEWSPHRDKGLSRNQRLEGEAELELPASRRVNVLAMTAMLRCVRKAVLAHGGYIVDLEDLTAGEEISTVQNETTNALLRHIGVRPCALTTPLRRGFSA